ncbi:MAG: SDR family oxidoreductase [Proteobacteria bacterium]|nr:SDR family oxidoreductase [Pseudomonadota bacterium]
MKFGKKHALITGSGKRLGRSIAENLLKQGMNISAHFFQSQSEINELKQWAKDLGLGQVVPVQADLTDFEQVERLAEQVHDSLGPVDLLVNSASDFYPTPFGATTESEWDHLLNLNLKAPFFLTQKLSVHMSHGGNVIFISDVHASRPIQRFAPYCATKAGLLALTKSLAQELAPKIRVNSISPGTILPPEKATHEQIHRASERSLLKRVGTPQDLWNGLLFLCRNEYITGFDLIIDGGRALS